jgi:signal transduction histidine kinase
MTPIPLSNSGLQMNDMAMELKCVVSVPVLKYLRAKYGDAEMKRIVAETGMAPEYVANSANWISFDYFSRLLRKLVDVTGDPNSPFEAARLHSDKGSYTAVGLILIQLDSPETVYRLIVQFHSLWTKVNEWRLLEIGRNRCVISVSFPAAKQDRNNCLAIQGSLAAAPHQFGLPSATVEEKQCACNGAGACVYEIHWVNKPTRLWGFTGALAGLAAGLGFWFAQGAPSLIGFSTLLALAGYVAGRRIDYGVRLKKVYTQNEEQANSLLESIREIEKLNQDLQQKVEQRTAELSHANERLESTIKDLRESQEKVILAERQGAVGVLAAGMAHEMNNPMNAIRLSLQALRESLLPGDEMSTVVETAIRATGRCSRIVSDLLSFSREPQQIAAVSLRDIVTETLIDFQKDHPGEFRITTQFSVPVVPLHLDRAQIKQAITNILANAYDAMEGKGEVDVSLDGGDKDVVLTITDHGPGIEEALLRRVFDPFFTTKKSAARKGTGLGLSIAYQLVHRNGGVIEVHSEKGRGAAFVIRFPLTADKSAPHDQTGAHD